MLIATRYLAFIPSGLYLLDLRYAGSRDSSRSEVRSSSRRRSRWATWRNAFLRRLFALLHHRRPFCTERIAAPLLAGFLDPLTRTIRDLTGRRTVTFYAGRMGRSLLRELRETGGERVLGLSTTFHGCGGAASTAHQCSAARKIAATLPKRLPTSCSSFRRAARAPNAIAAGVATPASRAGSCGARPTRPARRPGRIQSERAHAARSAACRDPGCLACAAVLALYAWEASSRKTTIFDELGGRSSRAIGHRPRRCPGEPRPFKSLYAYLIAPAWWSGLLDGLLVDQAIRRGADVSHGFLSISGVCSSQGALRCCRVRLDPHFRKCSTRIPLPEALAYLVFAGVAYLCVRSLAGGRRAGDVAIAASPVENRRCAASWRCSPAPTSSRRSSLSSQGRRRRCALAGALDHVARDPVLGALVAELGRSARSRKYAVISRRGRIRMEPGL